MILEQTSYHEPPALREIGAEPALRGRRHERDGAEDHSIGTTSGECRTLRGDEHIAGGDEAQREWVIEGNPHWAGNWNKQWYGVRRFFGYLDRKSVV